MGLRAIDGFKHFTTHHCVTGSMRHIYAFYGHDLSEDFLLGLGEGVGMAYFRFKGVAPFIGGRAQPKPSMEEIAGTRTGVIVTPHKSSSDKAAEKVLVERLRRGEPTMLQVDMGFLPYFDFGGQEYHFGGHVIIACGIDLESGEVLVADRDEKLHPVPLDCLRLARGSSFKPFSPNRAWVDFDFSGFRMPTRDELLASICNQAKAMLYPPIKNLGVAGIKKAAGEIPKWPSLSDGWSVQEALFSAYIFESDVGGSGGGIFRFMFSRFLTEASELARLPSLKKIAAEFHSIAEAWDLFGLECKRASEIPPASKAQDSAHLDEPLKNIAKSLLSIAELEESAWEKLLGAASAT